MAVHGALIACAGDDELVRVWDVTTSQLVNIFKHDTYINSIAFSPTENILASGSGDTTVKLWDVITGTETFIIENQDRPSSIAFSPDGQTLAWTGSGLRHKGLPDTINLLDITTESLIASYENPVGFNVNSIALSPDNRTFVTVDSLYGIVKVWDIITGNTIDLGHVGFKSTSFSPDSTMLASGGRRGVQLWDINTGESVTTPISVHVQLVSFSPDGRTLAYRVSGEKFTRLWDITTQTQIGSIDTQIGSPDWSTSYWAFSPDGKTLASASGRIIKLWDVETRQNIAILEGHLERIDSVTYSPDGNMLASTSEWDNTVRLWDIVTKQNTETFEGDCRNSVFSPDGTMLVFYELNIGIKLWNLVTQEMTIIDDDDFMTLPVFSPDGMILVFRHKFGNSIKLCNLVTHEVAIIDEDHFLTFLPDSTMMLLKSFSWESGEIVSAWDAKTARRITALDSAIFQDWKKPIFSPDGKTLAMVGQDSITLFHPEVLYNQLSSPAPASINLTNALQTKLLTNYPNPFNPETWIPYRLAEEADVTLTIYDVAGRVVRTLDIGHSKAGVYESRNKAIYWDGRNDLGESVASGVYFYHLMAGNYSATKRLVILK